MIIAGRQWANYSINDFSFSFLSIDQNTTITIEIFVKDRGEDHFIGAVHFISGKANREAAIEEAITWAKEVVTGHIKRARKAREAEIGADCSAFEG